MLIFGPYRTFSSTKLLIRLICSLVPVTWSIYQVLKAGVRDHVKILDYYSPDKMPLLFVWNKLYCIFSTNLSISVVVYVTLRSIHWVNAVLRKGVQKWNFPLWYGNISITIFTSSGEGVANNAFFSELWAPNGNIIYVKQTLASFNAFIKCCFSFIRYVN